MQPFVPPRALTIEELPGIVEQYRVAAKNAPAAGFDGVEVKATNGYLLDEFLRDGTNRRTDAYGGSVDNHARLLLKVLDAVYEVWGSHQVGVRLSPSRPSTTCVTPTPRRPSAGWWNCSIRSIWPNCTSPGWAWTPPAPPSRPSTSVSCSGCSKEVAKGEADQVAFGTLFLANQDLVERLRRDAPLNRPDPASFCGSDERGYTDYPFLEG